MQVKVMFFCYDFGARFLGLLQRSHLTNLGGPALAGLSAVLLLLIFVCFVFSSWRTRLRFLTHVLSISEIAVFFLGWRARIGALFFPFFQVREPALAGLSDFLL